MRFNSRSLNRDTRSLMSTDDKVAPGTSRKVGGRILAGGLVIVAVASLLLFAAIQNRSDKAIHSSGLNEREITQLREFLEDRTAERNAQQREFQRQLDQQARILCLTIVDFKSRAESKRTIQTLDRAMKQLRCAKVIKESPEKSAYTRTEIPDNAPITAPQVRHEAVKTPGTIVTKPTHKATTKAPLPATSPTSESTLITEPLLKPVCQILPILCTD